MTARARVRRVHPDRWIELAVLPAPRCSGCEEVCLWGWAPPSSLRVRDSGHYRAGDLVSLSLRSRHVLHGAVLLHGLPWMGLLAGAAVGAAGVGGDLGSLSGAAIGLGAGVFFGRWLQKHWRVSPQITKVHDSISLGA